LKKVVNHGGNLAYFDGTKLYRSGYTASDVDDFSVKDGKILITAIPTSQANILGYAVKVSPNTQYTISHDKSQAVGGLYLVEYSEYPTFTLGGAGAGVNHDRTASTADYTFTTASTARWLVIGNALSNTLPSIGEYLSNIQLNAGSTANTYSEPLYSPFIMGSKSENQFRNGNGEEGCLGGMVALRERHLHMMELILF
jgi:hypothetical protein